ncbi:MAG TPA: methyltransferase domain-containing protein [Acidimicrobiia bacterium]|nr:methyltransferase domain-containing protein [Acidimicrobiia bacterium]
MSDTYIHGHHESVLRSHRWRTAENSAGYLLPYLRPGMALLDVGCGPGTLTADLATRVAPGRVVAIDRSESVVAEARTATATTRNVEVAVGDVYQLEFSAGTFDVVHAHQVLQHLREPVAALREMKRVCRAGGIVAVRDADYGAMTWWPDDPGLDAWMDLYQRVARAAGTESDAGRRLLGWARAAGFDDVAASASVWSYASPVARRWWGGLWAERALESDFARLARDQGLATPEELTAISNAWSRWSEAEDGWFVIVHGEIVCRVGEEPPADEMAN